MSEGPLIILSRYERMIAGRYLLPGKGERFIAVVAGFSLGAVFLGVWALVLGIASFVLSCAFVTGIPAIIIGRQGQRAADEGLANNRSLSTAGVVLGWVAVGMSVVGIVIALVALGAGALTWRTSS